MPILLLRVRLLRGFLIFSAFFFFLKIYPTKYVQSQHYIQNSLETIIFMWLFYQFDMQLDLFILAYFRVYGFI